MRKTIYHSETYSSRLGRSLTALVAFFTANRTTLIFSIKVTIIKRPYNERGFRERALNNIFIGLVGLPIIIGITAMLNGCPQLPPTSTPSGFRLDRDSVQQMTPDTIERQARRIMGRPVAPTSVLVRSASPSTTPRPSAQCARPIPVFEATTHFPRWTIATGERGPLNVYDHSGGGLEITRRKSLVTTGYALRTTFLLQPVGFG